MGIKKRKLRKSRRSKQLKEFCSLSEHDLDAKYDETKLQISKAESFMMECEENEKYIEAAKQKQQIGRLKSMLELISIAQVNAQQRVTKIEIEEMGVREQEKFDELWEKKTQEYIQKTQLQYDKLKKRQDTELKAIRSKLEKKEFQSRNCSLLINLRLKQKKLAKSKRYVEAENIRRNAQIIEIEERKKFIIKNQEANQRKLDKLFDKHKIEVENLQSKFDTEKRKLTEARRVDHGRLRNRLRKMTFDIQKKSAKAKRRGKEMKVPRLNMKRIEKVPKSARGRRKEPLPDTRVVQSARRPEP